MWRKLQPYLTVLAGGCNPMWRSWLEAATLCGGAGWRLQAYVAVLAHPLRRPWRPADRPCRARPGKHGHSKYDHRKPGHSKSSHSKCMAIVRGAPAPQADRCSTATRGPPRLRLRRRRLRRRLRLRRQLRLRLRRWDFWLSACRRARRRAQSSRCPASPAHEHICTRAVSTLMSCVLAVATCDNGALGEPPSNPPYDAALQPYPKTTLP